MAFTNTEPQNHQGENTWFTPRHLIDVLGPFDLDPCTMSFRPFNTAKKHVCFDRGIDGLKVKWFGDVWLNPPYGKELTPFVKKFIKHRHGVMLIFARMGSENVQLLLESGAYAFCLRKRIYFIQKDGMKSTNAGTDSILVFFDKKWKTKLSKIEGILIKGKRLNT